MRNRRRQEEDSDAFNMTLVGLKGERDHGDRPSGTVTMDAAVFVLGKQGGIF
jgi:hypothetical protein